MEQDEVKQGVLDNLDRAIKYASMIPADVDEMATTIIESAETIKTIVNKPEMTEHIINVLAWCINVGAFVSIVEAAVTVEEDDDGAIH